ncbi:MAG: hypothetical protein AAFY98_11790 [Verrucomicrobiota bacterium]
MLRLLNLVVLTFIFGPILNAETWTVQSESDWKASGSEATGITFEEGLAKPEAEKASYRSAIKTFSDKQKATRFIIKQTAEWKNWTDAGRVVPSVLGDAPVALALGPQNYWMFGRNRSKNKTNAEEEATLEGFDIPLKTTSDPHVFNAPGGLEKALSGYHAWQSRDMVNWVHHGPVTEGFSRWSTTAEYADGKLYIYYDFPNDQDPHLYIDTDLTDGKPGENIGMAFKDPSNGSDCAIIRDLEGNFHLIYEDWSPINAQKHAWDSPLAGHAVSKDGKGNFEILAPAVDYRTNPTGKEGKHTHPHWNKEDPENYPTSEVVYEIHEPAQDAFGDWAAISIGGQYYLFADYDPKREPGEKKHSMSVAMFTADSIDGPFRFYGNVGNGHPDPDIMFAEGQFYLLTQTKSDFVSPGPWVEKVEARVGVDTSNDGQVDQWTDWQEVRESYDHIEGFAKQISVDPAAIDLTSLPEGYAFQFELRIEDMTDNESKPILDQVILEF